VRRLAAFAVALAALLALPAVAGAHPLGNFSVNHLTEVSVSADRVDVRYVLDQAEIPTFQERDLGDAQVLAGKRAEVTKRLVVTVDGRRVVLRPAGRAVLTHPAGQGGLRTTRLELPLTAPARGGRRVEVRDETYPGRVGWKAVVATRGTGTAVRSSAPGRDPTNGLRRYPADLLRSPSDVRMASLDVAPGAGTLEAPGFPAQRGGGDASRGDALTRAFGDAAAGKGILILLLVTAFGWGALHALSPGHGKAMVAAYLVGTRGTPRHAVLLGATVTVTHTIGVFALGAVALLLSNYILPEDLYPWLNLASGLLVVGVGAAVLRSRMRHSRAHTRGHHHHHHHDHSHVGHSHSHAPPERLDMRGLLALGASAGLIPCPSALVVLLGAIAQGQIALGMLLIVAFSLGLAATLVGLGLAVVLAAKAMTRLPVPGRVTAALPTVSALAIVVVGCVLTLQAVPQVA
jgi:ABC-type nickel/cobalt efflux system permease component RcnA